ncbi:oligoribonuclease, mitochondrial isoform X2 [Periplaneta americana]
MASNKRTFASDAKNHLVWVDMEMTGLEVTDHHILEVACLITDSELNIVAEGPDLIIHQSDEILQSMNGWSKEHHGQSGLTTASKNSKITIEDAEKQLLDFLKTYIPPGKCPLAGNSVYMDRTFMRRYLPQVDNYLHYRIVDVSTVKELCRRWCPSVYAKVPTKVLSHRALSDIKESVTELQYYKSSFLKADE